MDQIPLVTEQIDAGRKVVERLMQNGIPIPAAAWVKESDLWQWYLYLVTPLVGPEGATTPVYHRINAILRAGPQPPEVDLFHIKVVDPTEPVGKAILEAQKRRVRPWDDPGSSLGPVSIDGAYFYPPLVAAGQ
jgi:hypothetical protein